MSNLYKILEVLIKSSRATAIKGTRDNERTSVPDLCIKGVPENQGSKCLQKAEKSQ